MKLNRKILFVLVTLVIAFGGCKKTNDDVPSGNESTVNPMLMWRFYITWKIDSYIVNGVTTPATTVYTIQFNQNGVFTEADGSVIFNGTWEFVNNKESIQITIGGQTSTVKILKFEINQLWFQEPTSTDEDHFIPN